MGITRFFSFKISSNTKSLKRDKLVGYCIKCSFYLDDCPQRYNLDNIVNNINFSYEPLKDEINKTNCIKVGYYNYLIAIIN